MAGAIGPRSSFLRGVRKFGAIITVEEHFHHPEVMARVQELSGQRPAGRLYAAVVEALEAEEQLEPTRWFGACLRVTRAASVENRNWQTNWRTLEHDLPHRWGDQRRQRAHGS
jgi:hypothetical protein